MSKWSLLSALRCELMMRSRPCFHVHQSSVLIESNVGTTTKAHELMWSAPKEQGCKKTTSRTLLQNAFRQPSGCQEVSSSCPSCHCPRSAMPSHLSYWDNAKFRPLQAGKVLRRELRRWAVEELGDANGTYHAESFASAYDPSRNYSVG